MKKVLAAALLAALLAAGEAMAISAQGSGFGTLATARGIGAGRASFAGGVGLADATTAFGMVRYGFADYLEGRFKLGLRDDAGMDAVLQIGADVTYQFWSVGPQSPNPMDLAFGGMIEYFPPDYLDDVDESLWMFGGYAIGSYPFALNNGMKLSPYGRLNLRVESFGTDVRGGDNSELEFGLNGGAMLEITPTLNAYGEFQIDGNDGVFLGLEFLIM
ncbi:MAG TPA: hypothetical protein PLR32_09095 [candidate division Zixibacteria bacterium]|nr:hypothetical protein [candidate division Zixibacteria bacterium]MDD4918478.1 hypothetical protein [candidate division Zixibacteria bacterium]MDM7971805.1 hypothetical protein [candidate division Zixibacteria bacterium]HOD65915.1 hypothetical protein [candidate division Zixibacteria bacterium]HOZ07634.1 hypothetical protein [candidate division Zixibacteria bacterium]